MSNNGNEIIVNEDLKNTDDLDTLNKVKRVRHEVENYLANIDKTEVQGIYDYNNIINIMNKHLRNIYKTLDLEFEEISLLELKDENGEVATEFKHFVVGYCFRNDTEETFYNCRIVNARTKAEAIYKYQKSIETMDNSLECFGVYDENEKYCSSIENKDIIE
jgi:hypothetical protein